MLSGRVYQCRPHAGARYYKIQLPKGLEPGTPFSNTIVATAMYLRFTHAISYKRLTRLLLDLLGLSISEGALDLAFRHGKPSLDAEVAADWIVASTRSWRWRRPPKTAADCASDTVRFEITCSTSSTIPR